MFGFIFGDFILSISFRFIKLETLLLGLDGNWIFDYVTPFIFIQYYDFDDKSPLLFEPLRKKNIIDVL